MAVSLLAHVVSDLCLGKPALRSLPHTATVVEALSALKNTDDNFLSVWKCDHAPNSKLNTGFNLDNKDDHGDDCKCVGKVSIVDVICYLCQDSNLASPSAALKAPVSVLLPKIPDLVMHVEPSSSLLEAIDLILQGAQNLVVPIKTRFSRRKQQQKLSATTTGLTTVHGGREFCWLTQEDIIRFLLSSIGLFSPIPALSIDSLGIIGTDIFTISYNSPVSSALETISSCLATQTSVAVVDGEEGILIGELSPSTLACCDETVAAAIATLSAGDLMAYIDCGGPPEDLVRVVMARLKQRGLESMLQKLTNSTNNSLISFSSSSSSDEESAVTRKYSRSMSYSARMVRRAEAIVCHPKSSLVAVMIQAIAHRVNYVWVVEDDSSLVGIVTFCNMLKVFREHLESMA